MAVEWYQIYQILLNVQKVMMAWTIGTMNQKLYFNFNTNLQGTKRKGSKLVGLTIRKKISIPVRFFLRKSKSRKSLHKDVL